MITTLLHLDVDTDSFVSAFPIKSEVLQHLYTLYDVKTGIMI